MTPDDALQAKARALCPAEEFRDGWHAGTVQCGHCNDILAALRDADRDATERAATVVREKCGPCGGTGVGGVSPDGSAEECEYCGRPIAAIREGVAR